MTLFNYQTGESIRELTQAEGERYMAVSGGGLCDNGAGTVSGAEFGVACTVYAI